MKRITLLLSLVVLNFFLSVNAQPVSINLEIPKPKAENDAYKVTSFTLENGLTVYLNEDHSQQKIFGAVVIKGGASRDPLDATGIAHYFEHIMFKGTTKIGTTNYSEEKILLDSIRIMYDLLGKSGDNVAFKKSIQDKINNLSVRAAAFAIPNEFDKIISEMGGTGLNAYTSYENIVYHNSFPPESIEKWMKVYSHRMDEPVFRLFQSELETVYEEKNMSMDNFGSNLFEEMYAGFYPNSPYGQHTVLGSVEHLKSPSLTKMMSYFKDFYCANNMALILVGDFNSEAIKPMIQNYFGKIRNGNPPQANPNVEKDFVGRVEVKKRMSPIPLGIIGFRTVSSKSEDKVIIDVMDKILTNSNGTGILDELSLNGDLMMATNFSDMHLDMGGEFILFVPKIPFQSISSAEKVVLKQLEKVKSGNFDDSLFYAVKYELLKDHLQSLESMEYRQYFIIESFMQGKSWEEHMDYTRKLESISKQDVINAAKKYFTNNYFVLQSKIGFPKKTKLEKPNFEPVAIKNSDKTSAYAEEIRNMSTPAIRPKFIDFNSDLRILDFQNNDLYIVKNPMNNIFTLEIKFGVGTYEMPELEYVAQYINLIGTKNLPYKNFRKQLQTKAISINAQANRDYFTIYVDGYDGDIDFALEKVKELLTNPEENSKMIKKISKDEKMNRKVECKDLSSESDILYSYAFYGDKSSYLTRYSIKRIKRLSYKNICESISKAISYKSQIHIVTNREEGEILKTLNELKLFKMNPERSNSPVVVEPKEVQKNTILFVDDKNAIQSHIKILIPSVAIPFEERYKLRPFNEYFGSGMYSLVFQEIREFRSYAYSSWGYFSTFYKFDSKGYFVGGLTTQSDKTLDAITTYMDLITKMPAKPERTQTIKNQLVLAVNSENSGYRGLSKRVAYYRSQGLNEDPNHIYYRKYTQLNFDDIQSFYNNTMPNRKYVISIVGNKEKINFEGLKKYGEITELKLNKLLVK